LKSLGQQWVVELYDCSPHQLDDIDFIRETMLAAAHKMGATVVEEVFHHFSPYGISGVVIIAESHLAIHIWKEYGYIALDVFTCGDGISPEVGFEVIKKAVDAKSSKVVKTLRGIKSELGIDESQPHKPE